MGVVDELDIPGSAPLAAWPLSQTPDPDTLVVRVLQGGVTIEPLPEDVHYNHETNSVSLVDFVPEYGAEIRLSYLAVETG